MPHPQDRPVAGVTVRARKTPLIICASALLIFFTYFAIFTPSLSRSRAVAAQSAGAWTDHGDERLPAVPCRGPRGKLLSEQTDDVLKKTKLDAVYAATMGGSFSELNLGEQGWMTAEARYGPYGYGEDKDTYAMTKVDWSAIDWAQLQDECLLRNIARFSNTTTIAEATQHGIKMPEDPVSTTREELPRRADFAGGRTALVLRMWDGYQYSPEDYWHIRSLIVEAALRSGGEYAVFLLVDAKERPIFSSRETYQAALRELVPAEFRSISILFNKQVRERWYAKVGVFDLVHQMMQPLQLFAHEVPGFDFYWDLEADVRYTGDALAHLDAIAKFAREEPRRQARERASFFYLPAVHGTYHEFRQKVDAAMRSGDDSESAGGVWGPVPNAAIKQPTGPAPPVARPIEDEFHWGVGADADVIVTTPCNEVAELEAWVFRDWLRGFTGTESANPRRLVCSPAVSRGSYNLLETIHRAQADAGLAVPSEATLPSFALWHGFKMSLPPQPWYLMRNLEETSPAQFDAWFNGGVDNIPASGLAHGEAMYKANRPEVIRTASWWFASPLPRRLMDEWLYGDSDEHRSSSSAAEEELLYMLARGPDGKVYAPPLALHPVKTSGNS